MIRLFVLVLLLVAVSTPAHADAIKDCGQTKDLDRRISGCSRYIDANVSSRVLQVWENVTAAIGARGHAYRKKGQHDLAIKDFTRVIKRKGEIVPATLLNRAISYEVISEREKAIRDYRAIVQFLKNNPYYKSKYGVHADHARKALARLGAAPAAQTSPNKPAPKPDTGNQDPKTRKASAEKSMQEGNHQFFSGNIDAAIAAYSKSIAAYPSSYAYFARGNVYEKIGRKADAIADHRKALALNPNEALSKAALRRMGAAPAIKHTSKTPPPKPAKLAIKDSQAAYARGLAHRKKRQYDKAIVEHTKAIKLNPKNAEAYLDRGRAYFARNKLDLAIADYSQTLILNPKDIRALNNRGISYRNKDLPDKAIRDLSAAIRLKPKRYVFYYNRGLAYRDKGEFDRAIADFDESLRLKPKVPEAHYNRGFTLYKKGLYERAITDFDKAIKLHPKMWNAYRERGYAYSRLGKYEKANADYSKAKRLNPKIVINIPKKDEAAPAPGVTGGNASSELDLAFWNDVKNSSDPDMLQAYLDQFPDGVFARLARLKLGKLKKSR